MGGCQNYGPFLDPYYDTAPNLLNTQNGTIILTTTQTQKNVEHELSCAVKNRVLSGMVGRRLHEDRMRPGGMLCYNARLNEDRMRPGGMLCYNATSVHKSITT